MPLEYFESFLALVEYDGGKNLEPSKLGEYLNGIAQVIDATNAAKQLPPQKIEAAHQNLQDLFTAIKKVLEVNDPRSPSPYQKMTLNSLNKQNVESLINIGESLSKASNLKISIGPILLMLKDIKQQLPESKVNDPEYTHQVTPTRKRQRITTPLYNLANKAFSFTRGAQLANGLKQCMKELERIQAKWENDPQNKGRPSTPRRSP